MLLAAISLSNLLTMFLRTKTNLYFIFFRLIMSQYIINANSKLSPSKIHRSRLKIGQTDELGSVRMPTVISSHWYSIFRQTELAGGGPEGLIIPLSEQLRGNVDLARHPHKISEWAKAQGFKFNSHLQIISGDIMESVLVGLLKAHDSEPNDFGTALSETVTPADWAAGDFSFTYLNEDTIWGTGESGTHESKLVDRLDQPGLDIWGQLLTKVARQSALGHLSGPFSMEFMLANPMVGLNPDRHTVGVLMDSYAKHVFNIDNGRLLRRSGGTFGTVIGDIFTTKFCEQNCCNLIIGLGHNDMKLSIHDREKNWGEFYNQFLAPAIERRGENVQSSLLILPIPVPKYAAELGWYNRWLKNKLVGTGVSILDWDEYCPFVVGGRLVKKYFMLYDDVHLNREGFLVLWKLCCEKFPGLRFSELTLNEKAYEGGDSVTTCKGVPGFRSESYVKSVVQACADSPRSRSASSAQFGPSLGTLPETDVTRGRSKSGGFGKLSDDRRESSMIREQPLSLGRHSNQSAEFGVAGCSYRPQDGMGSSSVMSAGNCFPRPMAGKGCFPRSTMTSGPTRPPFGSTAPFGGANAVPVAPRSAATANAVAGAFPVVGTGANQPGARTDNGGAGPSYGSYAYGSMCKRGRY